MTTVASKLLIYSDPHLGVKRKTNTSLKSSMRLENSVMDTLNFLVTKKKAQMGCDMAICLGDLFDKYSNPEKVIESAATAVQNTEIILAGNHDMENRAGSLGSLQLLKSMRPSSEGILVNKIDAYEPFHIEHGLTQFIAIPHVSSQELFEKAIGEACETAEQLKGWKVLLLHCNYNLTYENLPDTTLNLTDQLAVNALSSFHKVFMGHEHTPTEHHNGRIVVLGNIHPLSFSDISTKRALVYDSVTGDVESITLWENLSYAGLASEAESNVCQFMELTDDLPAGDTNKLAAALLKNPAVFAVRVLHKNESLKKASLSKACIESLPDRISADLEHTDPALHTLWEELKNAVE